VIDSVAALTPRAELEGEMGDSPARPAGPPDEPGAAQADRLDLQDELHGDLHQPDPHEDRRDVRQPETTTGGNALKFYASVRLDIRRIGAIKDRDEVVGNQTRVKVVKNKVAPPFKQVEFDIMYGEGVSKTGELIDLGVKAGIVEKSGAWFSYNGERIGQGREKTRQFLKENPAIADEIEDAVRRNAGLLADELLSAGMETSEEDDTPDAAEG
jgi:recombination protein RecA